MGVPTIRIGSLDVSRVIIGGNPFSGFSHQSPERDAQMRHWFTTARIKQALADAEGLGVNTHVGRADHHIMRVLLEHWDEGGRIQWFAQTCPEVGSVTHGVNNAIRGRASACFLHGGMMDYLLANGALDEIPDAIARIKDAGMPAGVAGHNPDVFRWAEDHLDCDFYMCSYYNPSNRAAAPEHDPDAREWFNDADRETMVRLIADLPRPVIHYKVMAAGRNDPADALAFVARHLRDGDAVCVGVFPGDKPDMLAEDIRLLEEATATAE